MASAPKRYGRLAAALAAGALLAVLLRRALTAAAAQLAVAWLLVALALPLCRALERSLSKPLAAALALLTLAGAVALIGGAIVPPMVRQAVQLSGMVPELWHQATRLLNQLQATLSQHGIPLSPLRDNLMDGLVSWFTATVNAMFQYFRQPPPACPR